MTLNINQSETNQLVDHAVSADHWLKVNEGKMMDIFLDLVREPRELQNVTVMLIPVEVGALRAVSNSLEKRLEKLEIETMHPTVLLRSARILRRVLES